MTYPMDRQETLEWIQHLRWQVDADDKKFFLSAKVNENFTHYLDFQDNYNAALFVYPKAFACIICHAPHKNMQKICDEYGLHLVGFTEKAIQRISKEQQKLQNIQNLYERLVE